ncbi:hypothetical protein IOD14_42620 [Streptomyces sp. A2-16]|uniref:hypothetical protein n=1 Tax=Streptomyces sp. A2-16 TaxID=2781734 RepID=UPI001BB0B1E9|nr:hypothetical protein [Streptomyces sp. A2-16]QUC62922.1 hypothetical protein IOD14_42620 [Streptomyces sp. A2-16]
MDERHTNSAEDTQRQAAEDLLGADTFALGLRITTELGGDDSTLLSRWMALRIAQLMRDVEEADDASVREEAARTCEDLVLRVWEARSNWPQGWPPESARQVVSGLEEPSPWRRARMPEQDDDVSWWTVLPAALDLLSEEQALWRLTALADVDPSDIRAWLEQRGATLGEEERKQLESIADAAEHAEERLDERLTDRSASLQLARGRQQREQGTSLTAPERAESALRQIRKLSRARLKLAERVAARAKTSS